MALAILELAEGSHGEVLERLTVIATVEASELAHATLDEPLLPPPSQPEYTRTSRLSSPASEAVA